MEKEKAHQPAARDCERCHKPHFTVEPTLLAQQIQPLCGECHNLKDTTFGKAHIYIDPSVIDCKKCHDPHASKDPKFFKVFVHPPFAERSCEDCHIVTK